MNANRLSEDLESVLDLTRPLWEEMRGQRLFLTGGTGFFGCWLLESFLWAEERLKLGARVVVLTRDSEKFRGRVPHLASHRAVELLQGDVRDFGFPAGEFSHVLHAATDSAVVPDARETFATIVRGTEHCLEFASKAGCSKFLLTSSGAVYGPQPAELSHVAESYRGAPDPLNPASVYGESKRTAELLCVLAGSERMHTKIARCFAFVGPYMNVNVHFAIGNFLRDQLEGRPIVVRGDGTPLRSYLYASDLCVWLWTMLFRAQAGVAYNVGSEEEISVAELARTVARPLSTEVRILGSPGTGPAARYVPSTQRARSDLGLRQMVALDTAIEKTRRWLQGNRETAQP